MTTIEKVRSIQEKARKNGLSLNKKFTDTYLTAHSMFKGPQELADRIINGMWDMCVHGINNGFDGSCKSALDGLSDIVVALTELGDEQVGKLTKYTVKADAILQKELQARKSVINVTEPLKQCLQSSIEAVDTMIELKNSGQGLSNIKEKQFELLAQSKTVLQEIQTRLADVGDTSSQDAQKLADAAIEAIKQWRNDCARNNLQSGSMKKLDEALEAVKKWGDLAVEVTRKTRAKDQHAFKNTDGLAAVVEGKTSLEMLDTFLARMDSEKTDIAAVRAQITERDQNRQKEIDDCEAALDDIKNQKAEYVSDFQNGKYDLATADRKIKALKPKEDDLLYRLSVLREDNGPDYLKATVDRREDIYKELESVVGVLAQFKNDLALLSDIICDVDFNLLIDMLGGRLSERNQAEAVKSIHTIIAGINDKIENLDTSAGRFKMDKVVRGNRAAIPETDRQARIDKERAEREQASSDLSPELLAILQGQPQDGDKQPQVLTPKRNIAFTDDDR